MAKYAINSETKWTMERLADNLDEVNGEFKDASVTMKNSITKLGASIGIFEEQLNSLVSDVESAQARGEEGINLLTQKLRQLADQIEQLLNL